MTNPARFLRERVELEKLEAEVDWLSTAWRIDSEWMIEVDVDLVVHGRTYAGRLTYPDVFPDSPPFVRPRDSTERWTEHQYGTGGSLCLQWRADNWQTNVTGADMVRSAFELLSTEQRPENPGVVPSVHRITAGQAMRNEAHRFVPTLGLLRVLSELPNQSIAALKTHFLLHSSTTVAFVSAVSVPGNEGQSIEDLPSGVAAYLPLFAWKGDGVAYRSNLIPLHARIQSVQDLLRTLSDAGFSTDEMITRENGSSKNSDRLVLLLGPDLVSMRVFGTSSGEHATLHEYQLVQASMPAVRLPPEHAQLSTIRFGIVGLGSIGSKVAISLARSGARRFLLVDDDYLIPANICRHELSWDSVGVHKVEAARDALSLIAAGISVDVRTHRVAGQESAVAAAAALKDLAACDVLIDATASADVFLRLASIAQTNRRALCWGELFAGGYGGLVARARPDLDPNPLAVRSAINEYFSTLPPAPFQNARGYDVDEEQPLLAYDSDVGYIATILTGLVVDTALRRTPSVYPHPAYLLGMRREWDFSQPFDTRPIDVTGMGWDDSVSSASETERGEALRALVEIAGGQRANSDSAS